MVSDFVKNIYCINLDRRPDRWDESELEFSKHGLQVQRFSAIDGNAINSEKQNGASDGDIGCTLSHCEILKALKKSNISHALILEDDVEFSENFNDLFSIYIKDVPDDWDIIYLGGNHAGKLIPVTDHVFKITKTYTTHAYIIKNAIYDGAIALLSQGQKQVDVYFSELQEKFNCYVIRPHLAWQRESFSDILQQPTHYKFLKDMNHYYKNITGWMDFEDIYKNAVNNLDGIFIEVGTANGMSAAYMAVEIKNSRKNIEFITCDIFQAAGQEEYARDHLEGFDFLTVQNAPSLLILSELKAAGTKPSFIFLDGDHSYDYVSQELDLAWEILADGGVLAGHDYSNPGSPQVKPAVDDFCKKMNLNFNVSGISFIIKK